jgi:hypothetical protein
VKTYKIIARPDLRFVRPGLPSPLSKDLLVEALAGVALRELSEDEWDRRTVDVRLNRPTDAEALNEIIGLLDQLGFAIIKVTVTEWVNEVVERAVVGFLGGGVIGGVTTENAVVALIASAAGALVAGLTGAEVQKVKAEYDGRRDIQGNWSFREIPRQQPSVSGSQPGFSPA